MSNGLIKSLNPMNLVEGALEMPLLGWARQAEITSDRAGLLAIGSEEIARRVLLSWSLKSSVLYKQINIQAWMDQENETGDDLTKLSEMITSSAPYISRRLMAAYSASRELKQYRSIIERFLPAKQTASQNQPGFVRVTCPHCKGTMRVSSTATEGKEALNVRCPNPNCGKVMILRKKQNVQISGGIHG
jgi:ribosomal protein S27E